MIDQEAFNIGDSVRVKRVWMRGVGDDSGGTGTVVGLPPEGQSGVGLYAVLLNLGEIRGFAPDALELCSQAVAGLQSAVQRLREKRDGLFHDMLCLVAASRRADVRDPSTRMQIETEVRRMSASWADADAAALRRKEFLENPALRKRLIGSLTKYLELGDLLDQLAELMVADSW